MGGGECYWYVEYVFITGCFSWVAMFAVKATRVELVLTESREVTGWMTTEIMKVNCFLFHFFVREVGGWGGR